MAKGGGGRGKCTVCLESFSGEASWNMHRAGSYGDPIHDAKGNVIAWTKPQRRCLSIEELTAKGMTKNARGDWTTGKTRDAAVVALLSGKVEEEIEEDEEETADVT